MNAANSNYVSNNRNSCIEPIKDELCETSIHLKNLFSFYAACNSPFRNIDEDPLDCETSEGQLLPSEETDTDGEEENSLNQNDIKEHCNIIQHVNTEVTDYGKFSVIDSAFHDNDNVPKTCQENKSKLYSNLKTLLQNLSQDMAEVHQLNYVCSSCRKVFSRKQCLRQHIILCQNFPLRSGSMKKGKAGRVKTWKISCPKCNRKFPQKASLQRHLNGNSCSIRCKICGYILRKPCELKRHMVVHTRERIFCAYCDQKFIRPYELTKHIIEHNIQFYRCLICTKNFISLKELEHHETMIHFDTGVKNRNLKKKISKQTGKHKINELFCNYCKVYFEIESSHNQHMAKHSSAHSGTDSMTKKSKKIISTFSCNICSRSFNNIDVFKYHKSTHSIEEIKPFGCAYCEKRFVKKKSLISHLSHCPF